MDAKITCIFETSKMFNKNIFRRSFNRRQYFRKVKGKKHLEICKK